MGFLDDSDSDSDDSSSSFGRRKPPAAAPAPPPQKSRFSSSSSDSSSSSPLQKKPPAQPPAKKPSALYDSDDDSDSDVSASTDTGKRAPRSRKSAAPAPAPKANSASGSSGDSSSKKKAALPPAPSAKSVSSSSKSKRSVSFKSGTAGQQQEEGNESAKEKGSSSRAGSHRPEPVPEKDGSSSSKSGTKSKESNKSKSSKVAEESKGSKATQFNGSQSKEAQSKASQSKVSQSKENQPPQEGKQGSQSGEAQSKGSQQQSSGSGSKGSKASQKQSSQAKSTGSGSRPGSKGSNAKANASGVPPQSGSQTSSKRNQTQSSQQEQQSRTPQSPHSQSKASASHNSKGSQFPQHPDQEPTAQSPHESQTSRSRGSKGSQGSKSNGQPSQTAPQSAQQQDQSITHTQEQKEEVQSPQNSASRRGSQSSQVGSGATKSPKGSKLSRGSKPKDSNSQGSHAPASSSSTNRAPPPPPPEGHSSHEDEEEVLIEEVSTSERSLPTHQQPIVTADHSIGIVSEDSSLTYSTKRHLTGQGSNELIEEGGELFEVVEELIPEDDHASGNDENTSSRQPQSAQVPTKQSLSTQVSPTQYTSMLNQLRAKPRKNLSVRFWRPHVTDLLEYRQAFDSPLSVNVAVHVAPNHNEVPWYDREYEELPWYLQPDLDEDDALTVLCKKVLLASENVEENLEQLERRAVRVEAHVIEFALKLKNKREQRKQMEEMEMTAPASRRVSQAVSNKSSPSSDTVQIDNRDQLEQIHETAPSPPMPAKTPRRLSSLLIGPESVLENSSYSSGSSEVSRLSRQKALLTQSERPSWQNISSTAQRPQSTEIGRRWSTADIGMAVPTHAGSRRPKQRWSMVDSGYKPKKRSKAAKPKSPSLESVSQQSQSPESLSLQNTTPTSDQAQFSQTQAQSQSPPMATSNQLAEYLPFKPEFQHEKEPGESQQPMVQKRQHNSTDTEPVKTASDVERVAQPSPFQSEVIPKPVERVAQSSQFQMALVPLHIDLFESSSCAVESSMVVSSSSESETTDPNQRLPIYVRVQAERLQHEPNEDGRNTPAASQALVPLSAAKSRQIVQEEVVQIVEDHPSEFSVPFDEPKVYPQDFFQDEYFENNSRRKRATPRPISRKISQDPPAETLRDPNWRPDPHRRQKPDGMRSFGDILIPNGGSPLERNMSGISNVSSLSPWQQQARQTAQWQQEEGAMKLSLAPGSLEVEIEDLDGQYGKKPSLTNGKESESFISAEAQYTDDKLMVLSSKKDEESKVDIESSLPGLTDEERNHLVRKSSTDDIGSQQAFQISEPAKSGSPISDKSSQKILGIVICLCLMAVWAAVMVIAFTDFGRSNSSSEDGGSADNSNAPAPTMAPDTTAAPVPTVAPTPDVSSTAEPTPSPLDGATLLPSYTWDVIQRDGDSPQWEAWEWLLEQDLEGYTDDELLQRYAVATFYFATDGVEYGANGTSTGQSTTMWIDAESHECTWYDGIICNSDLVVQQFDFRQNNLRGTIPAEMGILTNLIRLDLGSNPLLRGTIPPQLGLLTDLQGLDLHENDLTGAIPSELGMLTVLSWLTLANQYSNSGVSTARNAGNRKLSSTIPPQLGQLTRLQHMRFEDNRLSGTIPNELANLANLQTLVLRRNLLTGPVPPLLSRLQQLQGLALDGNQLTAGIPDEISRLPNLIELHLHDNQLGGPLPGSLDTLSNTLSWLTLSDNRFQGPLPDSWADLSTLKYLQLENNAELTGTVPQLWGVKWTEAISIGLHGTALNGEIPLGMCYLKDDAGFPLETITVDCDLVTCTCGCQCVE